MDTVSAQLKCEGFIAEMEKCGLKNARQQVLETASSIEGGIKAVEQLIRRKQNLRELFAERILRQQEL